MRQSEEAFELVGNSNSRTASCASAGREISSSPAVGKWLFYKSALLAKAGLEARVSPRKAPPEQPRCQVTATAKSVEPMINAQKTYREGFEQ